jgi:hypothetical protein
MDAKDDSVNTLCILNMSSHIICYSTQLTSSPRRDALYLLHGPWCNHSIARRISGDLFSQRVRRRLHGIFISIVLTAS